MGLVRQVHRDARASRSSRRRASRPTTSSPRSPPRAATPATTSSSSPATATPTSSSRTRTSRSSTTSAACPTTRVYDEAGIEERTGVTPALYPQYAALRGDPSDNLPGVPGVGEKTAAKLITTYGGLDGIFEHLDEQTPEAPREPRRPRGQRPPEPRGDGARPRRAARPSASTTSSCDPCGDRRRRGAPPLRLPRVPHPLRPAGRGARHRPRPVVGRGARCSRPRSTSLDDAAGAAKVLAGARRRRRRRSPLAAAWTGAEGRSALEGLALVRDGATGDVVWLPGALLADAARARRARPRWPAPAAARSPPTRPSRSCGPSPASTSTCAAWPSTPRSPPTSSTRPRAATCSRSCWSATPAPASPTATPPPRASSTSTASATPASTATARRALAVDRLVAPLLAALDAQGLRALHDEIEVPLVGVLARMEDAGVGVDRDELQRLRDRLVADVRAPPRRDRRGRRPRVQRELHAAAARGPLRRARPRPAEEDEDRLLHRRRQPREAGRASTRSSSTSCATARSRSCAPPTATACSRRSAADGRIHATFNQTVARTGRLSLRPAEPAQHPGALRARAASSARRSSRADGCELLVADYNQIELRCIAHLAEDPGLIDGFESRPRHPHRDRVADLRRRAGRRHHRAAVEGEDGVLRPGLRHGGLRPRPAPQHPHRGGRRDPRRLLRGVPDGEGVHGAHRRRGPRAGLHRDAVRPPPADPRAGVVATSGSARRGSARR